MAEGIAYDGYDLGPAYELACRQMAEVDDMAQLCTRSDAQCVATSAWTEVIVRYLNRSYRVTVPGVNVLFADSRKDVPLQDKVLILHYLLSAKGVPISGEMVSFKELPGGAGYFRTFAKRAIEPLAKHFGEQPHRLVSAANELGAHPVTYGDAGVVIDAFSKVPITLILWQGDDEFPPRANVLFDNSVSDYLSTYDITVLCERITLELVEFSKQRNV